MSNKLEIEVNKVGEVEPPATCDIDDLFLFIPCCIDFHQEWRLGWYSYDEKVFYTEVSIAGNSHSVKVEPSHWIKALPTHPDSNIFK